MTTIEDHTQSLPTPCDPTTPIVRSGNPAAQEVIADYTLPHPPFGAMQVTHLCRRNDGAHTVVVTGIDMRGRVVDQRSGTVDVESLQISEDLTNTLCAYMMHKLEGLSADQPKPLPEQHLN